MDYRWWWMCLDNYTDATLPSEATRQGDRWNVSVTPTDSDLSEVVTISVHRHTPDGGVLTPTNAKVTDALPGPRGKTTTATTSTSLRVDRQRRR